MNDPQSPIAAAPPTSSPQDVMMQMWLDMCSTLAVAAAARLGIADVLATSSPQESAALARAVGADATALTRLLRTLVSLGILAQPQPHTYALTSLGAVLRSDRPDSMRDLLIAVTDTPHVQAWGKLHESVSSGQPSVPALFGMPIFSYYAAHPNERASFSRAMGNLSGLAAQGTVHHYDFSHARHIVDVGGAHGDLLLRILHANPHVRGTVFDLPHVADAARQAITVQGYDGRCEALGGDFFQAVPPGGDVYVLKLILHDWPDTEVVRILHHCRAVMPPDGTLLVIEMVLPDDNHLSPAHLSDLNMLVMTGGQERTAREYGALLAQTGFRLMRLIPTGSPYDVLEAVVV
jgi:O-methyltransferase domain/Dimerisation domain